MRNPEPSPSSGRCCTINGRAVTPPRSLTQSASRCPPYRCHVIAVPFRPAIFTGSLLLDGCVAATWKIVRLPGRARLVIESFKPMRVADREAVGEEGMRLLAFAASDASDHDIQFKRAA